MYFFLKAPAEFTAYQLQNTVTSTALFQFGVAVPNGIMQSQLQAGAQSFTVPYWNDPADGGEANITNDDPAVLNTPIEARGWKTGRPQVTPIRSDPMEHRVPRRAHRLFHQTHESASHPRREIDTLQ